MPSRDELIRELDNAYNEFRSTVEDLEERVFERKWLDNRWGVREIVAHLTGWHGQLSKGLERMARGEKATPEGEDWTDFDSYNATFAEHAKGKRRDEVLSELDAAVNAFKQSAMKLPEERFTEGRTAAALFNAAGISHFKEHTEMVRSWRNA